MSDTGRIRCFPNQIKDGKREKGAVLRLEVIWSNFPPGRFYCTLGFPKSPLGWQALQVDTYERNIWERNAVKIARETKMPIRTFSYVLLQISVFASVIQGAPFGMCLLKIFTDLLKNLYNDWKFYLIRSHGLRIPDERHSFILKTFQIMWRHFISQKL